MKQFIKLTLSMVYDTIVLCATVLMVGTLLGIGFYNGVIDGSDLFDGRAIVITTIAAD